MHFTIKKTKEDRANPYDDDSPLVPIDVLRVDSQYRVTFTRNIKKKLGILPDDKIIVYPHRYNNNESMVFKVQRDGGRIVQSWTLTQNSDKGKDISINSINVLNTNNNKRETSLDKKDRGLNDKVQNTELYKTPILLVDDEKDLLESFESLLRSEGYKNVKAFSDPKEVLKSFVDMAKFKLGVLDIRMPDINGMQLYNILKILNPKIKILFMTALDAVNELTSLMTDVNQEIDIIRKPISASQFVEKVTSKIKVINLLSWVGRTCFDIESLSVDYVRKSAVWSRQGRLLDYALSGSSACVFYRDWTEYFQFSRPVINWLYLWVNNLCKYVWDSRRRW